MEITKYCCGELAIGRTIEQIKNVQSGMDIQIGVS